MVSVTEILRASNISALQKWMFRNPHESASFPRWKLMLRYSEGPTNTRPQQGATSLSEPQSSEPKRRWPSVAPLGQRNMPSVSLTPLSLPSRSF